jgi:hypothetical protein
LLALQQPDVLLQLPDVLARGRQLVLKFGLMLVAVLLGGAEGKGEGMVRQLRGLEGAGQVVGDLLGLLGGIAEGGTKWLLLV